MKRGVVLVEGQTEEQFVNHCLVPRFSDRGLFLTPKIVETRRTAGVPHFKVRAIGIDRIRATCSHFAGWLHHLETIAAA